MKKKLLPRLALLALALMPAHQLFAQQSGEVRLATFGAAGATSQVSDRGSFSFTAGQTAFQWSGDDMVRVGVQQVFCIPSTQDIALTYCQDVAVASFEAQLPEGESIPNGVDLSVAGVTSFTMNFLTPEGCDSVVNFTVTVNPTRDTILKVQANECFTFFDTLRTETGTYVGHALTVDGCDSTVTLDLTIADPTQPIPVIDALMDRILTVKREGGIDYAYYMWYKDGKLLLEGDTAHTYQNADGSKLKGCYYVEVYVDAAHTIQLKSEEMCFGSEGIADVQEEISLALMPNPVNKGGVVRVRVNLAETQLQGARVVVFDAQGRRVVERAAMATTNLQADFAAGVYSVHIIMPNGKHAARKLVVR